MQAVDEAETQSLTAWAFSELMELETGHRNMLEPILPRPAFQFNLLDAEIAAFIAEGQLEQAKINALIEKIDAPTEPQPVPAPDQTMIAADLPQNESMALYSRQFEPDYTPDVQIFNDNGDLLKIDTSKGIDLPNITIDPRDGGTYESEIVALQPVMDILQSIQDQVPDSIQTAGNSLYDQLTGNKDGERGSA